MYVASWDGIKNPMSLLVVHHHATGQVFSDGVVIRIIIQENNSLKSETFIDSKSEARRNELRLGLPLKSLQRCFHVNGGVFAILLQF